MGEIVAFVTYESPWAPCGGVTAVMRRLPQEVEAASARPTVVITPFHRRSVRTTALAMHDDPGHVDVTHGGATVRVAVLRHDAQVPWYFLAPAAGAPHGETRPFFDGARHPYDVPDADLLRDALFFGAAVVRALRAIAPDARWRLVMQDWTAATAALAFAGQPALDGTLHLTLHNSYDASPAAGMLEGVGIDSRHCPGSTILDRALGLVQSPVYTVSEQFARDFTEEPLQRDVLARHLQSPLGRTSLLGVDNGPFTDLDVDPELLARVARSDAQALHEWKTRERQTALDALADHAPASPQPVWGDPARFQRDHAAWFVMAGRDDPRQKGYDVAAAAVEDYLSAHEGPRVPARFLFFPIPGDEDLDGLGFLRTLAERHPEHVLVLPFVWEAGFMTALRGASYGLMPSMYEPFGMANEFYLKGCVGIGRATGGILEQIVPLRGAAAFSRAVQRRAERFHPMSARPTGILFREPDDLDSTLEGWTRINDAGYKAEGCSRVEERRRYPLFRAITRELRVSIEDGVRVYLEQPALYCQMLAEGVGYIQRTFSWPRAAQEYARHLT